MSLAVHALSLCLLILVSEDEIFLLRYVNCLNIRDLSFNEMAEICLKHRNIWYQITLGQEKKKKEKKNANEKATQKMHIINVQWMKFSNLYAWNTPWRFDMILKSINRPHSAKSCKNEFFHNTLQAKFANHYSAGCNQFVDSRFPL